MKPTASDRLTIRRYAEADEPAVLSLLRPRWRVVPRANGQADFFRWKHHDNPFGRSLDLAAFDGARSSASGSSCVGTFRSGGQRVAGRADGRHRDATQTYRGRGIFRELTMQSLDQREPTSR